MSALAAAPIRRPGLVSVRRLGDRTLWFAVFLGGFVFYEPAPYELFLAALIPIWFLAGLKLRGAFGPLVVLLVAYMVGGMLAVTQVRPELIGDGVMYMAVSLFLCLSAMWYAALVAEDWTRIRIVENAYVATAVTAASIGVLAYFRAIPFAETFLLYGRAAGPFQDPNVFGPFLVLPALLLARRLMVEPIGRHLPAAAALLVLVLGVFLSFSRAAWGLLAVALPLLAAVVSANAASNRQRLKLLGLVVMGVAVLTVLLMVAASIPAVQEILVQRAKLVQDYDGKTGSELGRFARHAAGFLLATEKPLGIGPNEFDKLYIEATHNNYLKALMEYGWIGFVAYVTLVVWTVAKALPLLLRPRPWQGFAQCVVICFCLHLAMQWIIDNDHWRHFYMMLGLIWGLIAAERYAVAARGRRATGY